MTQAENTLKYTHTYIYTLIIFSCHKGKFQGMQWEAYKMSQLFWGGHFHFGVTCLHKLSIHGVETILQRICLQVRLN